MQQTPKVSRTIEESVGEAIAEWRVGRGITQREFAAKLSAAGMPVDASAVSRIEKGTRSIRLTEAITIANVLDVDLDLLVDGIRTPDEELKKIRRNTDAFMSHLNAPFMLFAFGLLQAKWLLDDNPHLLESLRDDELGAPTSPGDYLRWCATRLAHQEVDPDDEVLTRTEEEAEQLIAAVMAWASSRIYADPELRGNGNGEHPEEA